jgi:hypothetical protein
MFLLPLAKGGGLPARSRFGEGRRGILKSLFQTTKLVRYYSEIEIYNNQIGPSGQFSRKETKTIPIEILTEIIYR